jgi:hypothetical protein
MNKQQPVFAVIVLDHGEKVPRIESWNSMEEGRHYVYAGPAPQMPPSPAVAVPDIATMVNRFLGWKLPEQFYPDCGITFTHNETWGPYPNNWPIGTNLLTADQAKGMFEYVLQDLISTPTPPSAEQSKINSIECQEDIYKNGVSVGLFDMGKEYADELCSRLTELTEYRYDWHYTAGRVHVKLISKASVEQPDSELYSSAVNKAWDRFQSKLNSDDPMKVNQPDIAAPSPVGYVWGFPDGTFSDDMWADEEEAENDFGVQFLGKAVPVYPHPPSVSAAPIKDLEIVNTVDFDDKFLAPKEFIDGARKAFGLGMTSRGQRTIFESTPNSKDDYFAQKFSNKPSAEDEEDWPEEPVLWAKPRDDSDDITEEEAKAQIEKFRKKFPGITDLWSNLPPLKSIDPVTGNVTYINEFKASHSVMSSIARTLKLMDQRIGVGHVRIGYSLSHDRPVFDWHATNSISLLYSETLISTDLSMVEMGEFVASFCDSVIELIEKAKSRGEWK